MKLVDQTTCSVMGPVVSVAEPCGNWEAVSIFLRAIDRHQRAAEVLHNAFLKAPEDSEEDKVAADALYWGGIACEHRVADLYGCLRDRGGLLLAGVGTLSFKAALAAEPKPVQEGGAA